MVRFAHRDPDFPHLLRIVADEARIAAALVEKDYWVTHTMWALHESALDVWFKGGTSLSKAFGLIERFSEDLDLRIEAGRASGFPAVRSWTSTNAGPVAARRAFFQALERAIVVADARILRDPAGPDAKARSASLRVEYPGSYIEELRREIRPFVLLEVGVARVTPFVVRPLSSFVHDWLERSGQLSELCDNRPRAVRCVHPLVTLLEKLDAISRRYEKADSAHAFVRHYEDAAAIIAAASRLPPLEVDLTLLVGEMLGAKQIVRRPSRDDPAFVLADPSRRQALEAAHRDIALMFWGKRRSLAQTCQIIRDWLTERLE